MRLSCGCIVTLYSERGERAYIVEEASEEHSDYQGLPHPPVNELRELWFESFGEPLPPDHSQS